MYRVLILESRHWVFVTSFNVVLTRIMCILHTVKIYEIEQRVGIIVLLQEKLSCSWLGNKDIFQHIKTYSSKPVRICSWWLMLSWAGYSLNTLQTPYF